MWWVVVFILLCSPLPAAYRVYKLRVEHLNADARVQKIQTVLTNLDHLQYEHYYGGYGWMRVSILDTWYCPGDTGDYRKFCKKPKESERIPASLERPKRPLPYNRQPVIP